MNYNLLSNISYCADYVAEISNILLYSHIGPAIIAVLLSCFVYFKSRNRLSTLLLIISTCFGFWVILNLTIWFSYDKSSFLMLGWSLIEIFSVLLFISTFLFFYNYISNHDLNSKLKILLFLPILPIVLLAPSLYLTGYDAQECIAIENNIYITYVTVVKILFSALILFTLIGKILTKNKVRSKREITILGFGLLTFLYSFFIANYVAELTEDFRYEMVGLISFAVFIGTLSYLISKYNTFQIKLAGAKVLVAALIILTGSQIAFFTSTASRVVDISTLILVSIFSYFLIRSVKNEIDQREKIEKLATDLSKANERLKELDKLKSEFVSIASHQLRSPLTSIRGYASMLVEESFGKLPEKALEPLKRIDDSARLMAMSIEDYLNVSRIEAGNMKYNMSEFNLRDEVEKVSDDVRPVAMEKGLVLLFRTDMNSKGIVKADIGKTVQIVHNLINNSMKYTPKGSITVLVHDNIQKKRIYVDIIDTGIGINKENLARLFQKFSRADNANTVNVAGTGLGLFVALRMAEAMGGSITAHSDGDGKGSKFTLELPLAM